MGRAITMYQMEIGVAVTNFFLHTTKNAFPVKVT